MIEKVDAVFIESDVNNRYEQIKYALKRGKHVLCDLPMTIGRRQQHELLEIAKKNDLVLMSGIKTAYSTAYYRLLLMIKSGEIGDVTSIETTCTSLDEVSKIKNYQKNDIWNAMDAWGATVLMPIFQILGTDYVDSMIVSKN